MPKLLVHACAAMIIAAAIADPGFAAPCPHNRDALGTARILEIDTSKGPVFGTYQYPSTLDLAPKEVVLTFDDGPEKRSTRTILHTLADECVKATFFVIGQMARNDPATLRMIAKAGHSIGAHSWSHPDLRYVSPAAAITQIERGFAAARAAARQPIARFLRFPGMRETPALRRYAAEHGIAIISTDISSDDWMGIGPRAIIQRTMARLARRGRGIILFHDRKPATAAALPGLLKAMKRKGYKVVHIVSREPFGPAKNPGNTKISKVKKSRPAEAVTPPAAR